MLAAVARSRRDLAARQTTSGDRVDVCVVLRDPTLVVLTPKLVAVPVPDVAALMTRLTRVLRSDVFDRKPCLSWLSVWSRTRAKVICTLELIIQYE